GTELLKQMQENPPESLKTGPTTPIATKDMAFLEKVKLKGNLGDLYDARDVTEVVYRTMRDLMSTDSADRVASELHEDTLPEASEKALHEDLAKLWQDTNPLVRFLSNIRPPLKFDDDTFFYRIKQEGSIPESTGPKTVVKAVFSATKEELSAERVKEIAGVLPGEVRELWESA
ncbi:MAG: DUF2267 domain-containing protein, partial [Leptolyngbya sp. SIO4C1]|nr:DUF2267 domain-containing protein [Leptolyngbya sp. SIO4C1]